MKALSQGASLGVLFFLAKIFLPRFSDSIVSSGIFFTVVYFSTGIAFLAFIILAIVPTSRHLILSQSKDDSSEMAMLIKCLSVSGGSFIGYNMCVLALYIIRAS